MKPTTLCFPVDPAGRLLLGCKKRGFGAGKWNGFGGKLEGKETFRSCAVREVREEAGIRINPDDLDLIGFLDFHFSKKPEDDKICLADMGHVHSLLLILDRIHQFQG